MLLLSPMASYKPYFYSFCKRAPITQRLAPMSELGSSLPPHSGQFTSQAGTTRSNTQKLELANLVLHLQLSSSVAQSCPTICNPMDHSTPGLPVHHQLLEFTQTHVHQVGDAIQTTHPLSPSSPPALNLSQHQVAKVLEFQLQHQSFQ